ncbi:hypothetical protein [Zavarzinella formosa]|uniref:hypothetical protein n=1 Tax=Zavarzinella formosa TaxID=360055 RepID=UPI0002E9D1BA|nr:hypothetical protein [Zavarzinella formosa]
MAATQLPPPTTTAAKIIIKKVTNALQDIDVTAEILPDGTTADKSVQGHTSFDPVGAWSDGQGGTVFFKTPGYSWEKKGALEIVSKLSGPVQIKGNVKIQTIYGPNAKATDTSGYGRGTTPEDEAAGTTSLGFHESCHRDDYVNFLKLKPLPAFGGKPGQTKQQYAQAVTAFGNAIQKYFTDMDQDSFRKTDEVGYKSTEYDAKGPRP